MRSSIVLVLAFTAVACAQESKQTVADVAKSARSAVVIVTSEDRDGNEAGLGSGFIIGEDGLIATALHAIGEARPIWVQTEDGKRHIVTEIHASDRSLDLAILRIKADGLKALSLAKVDKALAPGEQAIAIGHPLGLKNSVVSGRVAGERDFDGTSMWQVGMTIEPGNSGCPLLDMQGSVQGVMVMKATGKDPFGFAVKVDHLRRLIELPNPIAMSNWKTIGRIDSNRWEAKMGARWRQRSGRILVDGAGKGFGGRSLLLRADKQPAVPFELAVAVKLEKESGAAGLVFHSDSKDKHYGFYPSAGRLRLTSFEGPTVFSWNVIRELDTQHYKRGDWNEIKIRVEQDKIIGYVNGHEVVSVEEVGQSPGRIGLCKFRDTQAEFKRFRFGDEVKDQFATREKLDGLAAEMKEIGARAELRSEELAAYTSDVPRRLAALERQSRELESRAEQLRLLGQDIQTAAVCAQLEAIVASEQDGDIDLIAGALWIAKLDNGDLEVASYLETIDAMAHEVRKQFEESDDEPAKLEKLDAFLFEQNGYHGSRTDYYNAANSHLDRVIDDREGLPITLSVLYMSLADRLSLNVVGVGLPGHFVVRHEPSDDDPQIIDVFHRGKRLSRNEADALVFRMTGRGAQDSHYESAKHRDILSRMLVNLLGVAQSKEDSAGMLRYLEAIVTIDPDDAGMRGMRGVLRHQQGRKRAALEDIDWILAEEPKGIDLDQVRRMRRMFAK